MSKNSTNPTLPMEIGIHIVSKPSKFKRLPINWMLESVFYSSRWFIEALRSPDVKYNTWANGLKCNHPSFNVYPCWNKFLTGRPGVNNTRLCMLLHLPGNSN